MQTTKPLLPEALLADLEAFSAGVVARLRERIPSYAAVPLDEHRALVAGQMREILEGVARRAAPTTENLLVAEELGWRRAAQGVPVQDVIEAYHVCFQELWSALVGLAEAADDGPARLVAMVDVLWSWTHGLSAAVADGHAAALRTRAAERSELRARLFDALVAHEAGPAAERAAVALGFDATGPFQALCLPEPEDDGGDTVDRALAGRGILALRARDGVVTALVQGPALPAEIAALAGVGLGGVGTGLAGAVTSLRQAGYAMEHARRTGSSSRFDDAWLPCLLHADVGALRELLAPGRQAAAAHPHLAETVAAFAEQGFRVVDCARALHLHPNSARYRLDRWHQLTGWDPQTFDGLLRSVVAIGLPAY